MVFISAVQSFIETIQLFASLFSERLHYLPIYVSISFSTSIVLFSSNCSFIQLLKTHFYNGSNKHCVSHVFTPKP